MCEPKTIGQWLERFRSGRELTRTRFAELMDVSYNTVLAWEIGQNDVSRHVINKVVKEFGLSDVQHLAALKLPRKAPVAA